MGYRVVYGPMTKAPKKKTSKPLRLQLMTALFALLFVLAVRQVSPEGTQILRQFLMPENVTAAEAAFSEMVADIQAGEAVGDAFTAFCKHILEDGIRESY